MRRVPLFNVLVMLITSVALIVTIIADGISLSFWLMLVVWLVNVYLAVDEHRRARS